MKKKNIILGINWEQNSTVSLMIDGEIIESISEERFSRVKNDERYPKKAIDWILKKNKISSGDIYEVCFISTVWSPAYSLIRHYTNFSVKDYVNEQNIFWYPKIYENKKKSLINIYKNKLDLNQYPGKQFWNKVLLQYKNKFDHTSNKSLIKIGQEIRTKIVCNHLKIEKKKIKFVDHSLGHSSYGYFSSNSKDKRSLVLTLDAFGDYFNYSARIYKLNEKGYYDIKEISKGSNFIIGRLYRYVTLILGLKPNEHEYKVMGLAPYCKQEYFKEVLEIFRNFQKVDKLKFKDLKKPKDLYFVVKKLIETQRFDAIAGGLQAYSEELISNWINNCIKKSGIKNVCLAGGVALNVKANYLISKSKNIKNLYVPPSPDDSSQAMGACYARYNVFLKKNSNKNFRLHRPKKLRNAYLGYQISNKEIINVIRQYKLKNKFNLITKNINQKVSKLLAKGKIIARVKGKSEFGARSLGNRSILADPSNPDVKNKINEKIKNRDFWMPFAASTTYKKYHKYFVLSGDLSQFTYMTNCVDTKQDTRKKIIAAIHPYDYTCRPQIILKNQNPDYENLINCFGKIKNIYALLNTSFNFHGKPIVNTAKDAIDVFLNSDLDGLILENYFIYKKSL